ncbi:hypothetical protein BGZ57DRAFT_892236 [Hyaloscypha finlandica]|nr:hypothetical protein BGZ57DRAFT_892236 [Hyaloscypha finlandica]
MWHDSNIEQELRSIFGEGRDAPFYIYGDPAYSGAYGVLGAYTRVGGRTLLRDEKVFNIIIAQVRITIEQLFGNVLVIWGFSGHKYQQKAGQSPVAAYYLVSILLMNLMTCVRRENKVSQYFDLQPPTLDEYLHGV